MARRVHVSVVMEEGLVAEVTRLAEVDGRTRSNYIEWVLMRWVQRRKREREQKGG